MIDLDYTARDAELLALAREQALVGRRYARRYDRSHGELPPDELPEAAGVADPRALLAAHIDETSGPALLDALLQLEEVFGTVPFRKGRSESNFLGSKLVHVLGTEAQTARWGDKAIAIALTEPDAGSDPSRIRTLARFDEARSEWVLNGEKIFISLAQTADAVMVFALFARGDEKGMGIFIVDKGTPGLTVGPQLDKLGQRSWDTADLVFTECRLPAEAKLAGAMKDTLAVFNRSRPLVSAIALGYARAALELTQAALADAGQAINYRVTGASQLALIDRFQRLEALYEAARLVFIHTKWVEDTAGPDKIEASMTKAHAGRAVRRILDGCLEILGAEAASERHLIEMWLRDARVCDIYEGPGEVQRLIIARDLLGYSPAELA